MFTKLRFVGILLALALMFITVGSKTTPTYAQSPFGPAWQGPCYFCYPPPPPPPPPGWRHQFRYWGPPLERPQQPSLPQPDEEPVVSGHMEPSVVVKWNEAMLAAVRNGPPRPTVIARSLFMVHAAMYDAWTAYDPVAEPLFLDPVVRQPEANRTEANKAAAVSQAAYHTLVALFPYYEHDSAAFSRLMEILGYEIVTGGDPNTPAGLGYLAAQSVLTTRQADGSNAANNYADIVSDLYPELYQPVNSADPTSGRVPGQKDFDPNHWQPLRVPTGTKVDYTSLPVIDPADPTTYKDQTFLTPHWGSVEPFALTSGDQFRPPAPPQLGSNEPYTDALGRTMTNDEAYRTQFAEVLEMSANLTDEMKCIAEYWADGPRSETPPGHWNALAHGISYRDQHSIDEDVKLYLALNGALFDASIAAWDAKRTYDSIRPASAIRHLYAGQMIDAWGGPNQGTIQISGELWLPYQALTFVTPAFPEYVSGHSTFSAAAAEVLTRFTGSNRFYDGETVLYDDFNRDGLPDLLGQHVVGVNGNIFEDSPTKVINLHWETFQDAADEAAISRLYGGIHIQDGDRHGRRMGKLIAEQAYGLAEQYWTGTIEP
ncbi:MAG TPA: vanadium-dependent haloperoxidase [Anaerolineae bacterium]|nr:vanadium-dependent haloperoxidase [Anaerolineae bacterium]